jgi:prophage regulatory protein
MADHIHLRSKPSILRRRDLEMRLRLSRSTLYEKINPKSPRFDPTFPKPFRLGIGGGGAVGWLEIEIEAWIYAQIESSRRIAK